MSRDFRGREAGVTGIGVAQVFSIGLLIFILPVVVAFIVGW